MYHTRSWRQAPPASNRHTNQQLCCCRYDGFQNSLFARLAGAHHWLLGGSNSSHNASFSSSSPTSPSDHDLAKHRRKKTVAFSSNKSCATKLFYVVFSFQNLPFGNRLRFRKCSQRRKAAAAAATTATATATTALQARCRFRDNDNNNNILLPRTYHLAGRQVIHLFLPHSCTINNNNNDNNNNKNNDNNNNNADSPLVHSGTQASFGGLSRNWDDGTSPLNHENTGTNTTTARTTGTYCCDYCNQRICHWTHQFSWFNPADLETSTFGSEFTALKQAVEEAVTIRRILKWKKVGCKPVISSGTTSDLLGGINRILLMWIFDWLD